MYYLKNVLYLLEIIYQKINILQKIYNQMIFDFFVFLNFNNTENIVSIELKSFIKAFYWQFRILLMRVVFNLANSQYFLTNFNIETSHLGHKT
jgi:hypothetical protein